MKSVRRSSPYLRDCVQLVDDNADEQLVARQNLAEPRDRLHQLRELVQDLLPLEAGQPLELHVEDRLRLDDREPELRRSSPARASTRVLATHG